MFFFFLGPLDRPAIRFYQGLKELRVENVFFLASRRGIRASFMVPDQDEVGDGTVRFLEVFC